MDGGYEHTCALAKGSGAMYCFGGYNQAGELGTGNTNPVNLPTSVIVPAGVTSGWAALAAGESHTYGIAAGTGDLYSWGAWRSCTFQCIRDPRG